MPYRLFFINNFQHSAKLVQFIRHDLCCVWLPSLLKCQFIFASTLLFSCT